MYTNKLITPPQSVKNDNNTYLLLHGNNFIDSSKYQQNIIHDGHVEIVNNGKFDKGFKTGYTIETNHGKMGNLGKIEVTFKDPNAIFGNNEWTLDWWDNPQGPSSLTSSGHLCACSFPGLSICCTYDSGGMNKNASGLYSWGRSFATENNTTLNMFARTIGTARHFAFIKEQTRYKFYVNGVNVYSVGAVPGIRTYPKCYLFGYYATAATGYNSICSEIRLSNIARWTSNFTPPIKPYE